jgi:hypothetical protein
VNKIYAHEEFKHDGRTYKVGDEVCQIPKNITLQQLVSLATLGHVADHEPTKREKAESTKSEAPATDPPPRSPK